MRVSGKLYCIKNKNTYIGYKYHTSQFIIKTSILFLYTHYNNKLTYTLQHSNKFIALYIVIIFLGTTFSLPI